MVVLLLPVRLHAQCSGASPTWTTTPDESSVQTCVNNASAGDTVNITAGPGSATWTSTLTIGKAITVIGPGASSLIIYDYVNQAALFNYSASSTSGLFRLSGLSIEPSSSLTGAMVGNTFPTSVIVLSGTCTTVTCSSVRVDNLSFSGWVTYGYGNASNNYFSPLIAPDNVFGVIDHNQWISTTGGIFVDAGYSTYFGANESGSAFGDNSWSSPDTYGTASALYVEANTLDGTSTTGPTIYVTDTDYTGGARFVVRFNTLTNADVYEHGTETSQRVRGGRQIEVYNNNFTCSTTFTCNALLTMRSGTGLIFDNTINSGSGEMNTLVDMQNQRTFANFTPWGECDGTGPYDENDGTTYASGTLTAIQDNSSGNSPSTETDSSKSWPTNQWFVNGDPYSLVDTTLGLGLEISASSSDTLTVINRNQNSYPSPMVFAVGDAYKILRAPACLDQPGRSGGTLLSGTTPSPTGWASQALDPVYEWGDTSNVSLAAWIGPDSDKEIANRDFYTQAASFNGTSGTGTGTLANRPSSCTTGVAYWATDQGNWNLSSGGGQGQLFVCTATNAWSLYYQPYTYPHPLTNGAASVAPPTNVKVVSVQ